MQGPDGGIAVLLAQAPPTGHPDRGADSGGCYRPQSQAWKRQDEVASFADCLLNRGPDGEYMI